MSTRDEVWAELSREAAWERRRQSRGALCARGYDPCGESWCPTCGDDDPVVVVADDDEDDLCADCGPEAWRDEDEDEEEVQS